MRGACFTHENQSQKSHSGKREHLKIYASSHFIKYVKTISRTIYGISPEVGYKYEEPTVYGIIIMFL